MASLNNLRNIIYLSPLAIFMVGCAGGNNPGIEYAPDMYYSKAYEPFSQADSHSFNAFGSNSRTPVKGTIAFGKEDYSYNLPNNGEGYTRAATEITMPAHIMDENCEGQRLYGIYCSPCHGKEGKNDGKVFQRVASLVPGAWADGYQNDYIKNLPAGQIYHTLVYGKNNMGSHASVLNPTQRWQVIAYVKQLSQGNAVCNGSGNNSIVSETSTASAASDTVLTLNYQKVEIRAEEQAALSASLSAIQFETGSNQLKASSTKALDDLATLLKANEGLKIVINGHTDNAGDRIKNMQLSKSRAEAVKAYLIAKGYNANRFITNGFGDRKPLVNNDSEANKAKNRRVEIELAK